MISSKGRFVSWGAEMMRIGKVLGLCVMLLAASTHVVRGDEAADAASSKFEQGKRQFRLGQYDDAIALWKAAYELKGDPIFLFNIAQAYWKKGANEKAVEFYDSYLKDAKDAPNRDKVLERIAELKGLIEQQKRMAKNPPTEPIAPEHTAAPESPTPKLLPPPDTSAVDQRHGRTMKLAGIVTVGVGVALAATGVYFAVAASSAQSDVEKAGAAGGAWSPDIIARDDEGRRDALIGAVTLGAGAAAIVGGGVLYFLGVRQSRVTLVPQAAGLQLRVVF